MVMDLVNEVNIFERLDSCYYEVEKILENNETVATVLNPVTKQRIDRWQFGAYGWTSPVNILMTAAWYKWIFPEQDVCKIWSRNKDGKINGGFSIRNFDESYTVRFVTKYRLYNQFCSPNSGMQGTRALEKSRDHGRINRNTDLGQKVLFDIELFKNILNDINESDSGHARNIFNYFVEKALKVKERILNEMSNIPTANFDGNEKIKEIIFTAVYNFQDPQFVRVVVAALLENLILNVNRFRDCSLMGLGGSQTAADARARTPGDLWIENSQGDPIIGCEVKDPTKSFGFDVLAAIQDRLNNNKTMKYYIGVTAARDAVKNDDAEDRQWDIMVAEYLSQGLSVLFYNLNQFYDYVDFLCDIDDSIIDMIKLILIDTKDLKVNTVQNWTDLLREDAGEV